MGVNTLTYVPGSTDLGQLALAIQKLTDADNVRVSVNDYAGNDDGSVSIVEVGRGTDAAFDRIFELTIDREDGFGDGSKSHRASIHLSSYHRDYTADDKSRVSIQGTLIYGGNASAFWASLGDALVDFFGGVVDYNDCDASYVDTEKRPTRHAKVTDGDEQWTRTQAAINALTTVTDEAGLARYDEVEGLYNRKGEYRENGRVFQAAS